MSICAPYTFRELQRPGENIRSPGIVGKGVIYGHVCTENQT